MNEEQQFTSFLNHELSCLQNLLASLNQEYDALAGTDVAALETATQQKNQALAKQAQATIARQDFILSTHGQGSDQTELNQLHQLIEKYSNQTELSATLDELNSIAEQCQTANHNNGKLIMQRQQFTRNALDVLRQADTNPSTYSGQGSTIDQSESRTLGKA